MKQVHNAETVYMAEKSGNGGLSSGIALADELKEHLERDRSGYWFIRHPLVMFACYEPGNGQHAEIANTWLEKKQEGLRQAVDRGDWRLALMLHEKPWRLRALMDYGPKMSDEAYFENLGAVWTEIENVWQYHEVVPCMLAPTGRDKRKRHLMMTTEEQAVLRGLPEVITIYRGCGPGNERGWSWTLDVEQAEWFAERFGADEPDEFSGLVVVGECRTEAVIAYFGRRGEQEILVAHDDVRIMDRIRVSEDDESDDLEDDDVTDEDDSWDEASSPDDPAPRILTSRIRRFEPQPIWFAHGADGIHGLAHETRVLIWGQVLAEMVREEGMSVDADMLGWAAALHDTQRWDDGMDPDHGGRAAEWIVANEHLLPPSVPVERVAFLCRWHVPPDHRTPELTDELKVFKDADALDRWRINDLDPRFLRTQAATRLLEASRELWERTRHLTDERTAFSEVVRTATALGILVDD
jgi:hypothetical protein